MNFEQEIATVLKSQTNTSSRVNVVGALSYDQEHFQQAFNIALEMENRNLVKILYSNYNQGKIMVEFTLLGRSKVISD